ncbi:MAG: hypothetical protein AAF400_03045, partial [Bacteroidota bacterium]
SIAKFQSHIDKRLDESPQLPCIMLCHITIFHYVLANQNGDLHVDLEALETQTMSAQQQARVLTLTACRACIQHQDNKWGVDSFDYGCFVIFSREIEGRMAFQDGRLVKVCFFPDLNKNLYNLH